MNAPKKKKRKILLPISIGLACCALAGLCCLGLYAVGVGTSGSSNAPSAEQARETFTDVSDRQAQSETADGDGVSDSLSTDGLAITTASDGTRYISNQVIVGCDTALGTDAVVGALSQAGVSVTDATCIMEGYDGNPGYVTVTYDSGQDPRELSSTLCGIDGIASAEPNGIATLSDIDDAEEQSEDVSDNGAVVAQEPSESNESSADLADSAAALSAVSINDPKASTQWHLDAVGAYDAWSTAKASKNVTVAVIDSGVDYDHDDLADNLILGDYAYSVVTKKTGTDQVSDSVGHGTHVAGIIAAQTNNGIGVAGVSYNAQILPVQVTQKSTFSSSNIVSAIEYVVTLKQTDAVPDSIKNIKVINLSLGTSDASYTSALSSACAKADAAGITVCAATGNASSSSSVTAVQYPAACEGVIGVGSVSRSSDTFARSSFSNGGDGIDVVAPGDTIYSTISDNAYGYKSGTSMATPVVSGIAALLYAANPNLTTSQVVSTITSTATDLGEAGWDAYYGTGLVNAQAAVAATAGTTANVASFDLSGISNPGMTMYIDGVAHTMSVSGGKGTLQLADSTARVATLYTYNKESSDTHEVYPTHMYVWLLSGQSGKAYTVTRMSGFDDVLKYAGTSIRLTGNKGIRMITALPTSVKQQLAGSGYLGWQLEEYGTVIQFDETLAGADVLLTNTTYKNYAYKRNMADPVYSESDGSTKYTNVLVGFNEAQCAKDLSMRSYIILSNISSGERITMYGGAVHRSIGYVALQNKDAYAQSTEAGQYIWGIIHNVYGTIYG